MLGVVPPSLNPVAIPVGACEVGAGVPNERPPGLGVVLFGRGGGGGVVLEIKNNKGNTMLNFKVGIKIQSIMNSKNLVNCFV